MGLKLLVGILLFFGLLFLVIAVAWINSIDWTLWPTIRRARREVRKLARQSCPNAEVFSFGATEINPKHFAIWIKTQTDAERDRLRNDRALNEEFRNAVRRVGYPAEAVPFVGFGFESQETVDRDFAGSWYRATK